MKIQNSVGGLMRMIPAPALLAIRSRTVRHAVAGEPPGPPTRAAALDWRSSATGVAPILLLRELAQSAGPPVAARWAQGCVERACVDLPVLRSAAFARLLGGRLKGWGRWACRRQRPVRNRRLDWTIGLNYLTQPPGRIDALLGASRHRGRRLAVRGERLPLDGQSPDHRRPAWGASCTGIERSEPPVFFGIELLSGRCPLLDRRRVSSCSHATIPASSHGHPHTVSGHSRSRRRGASRARWKMDASPARCTASSAMASQTESAWMPGSSLSILALTSSTLSEPTIFSSCAWSSSRRSPCVGHRRWPRPVAVGAVVLLVARYGCRRCGSARTKRLREGGGAETEAGGQSLGKSGGLRLLWPAREKIEHESVPGPSGVPWTRHSAGTGAWTALDERMWRCGGSTGSPGRRRETDVTVDEEPTRGSPRESSSAAPPGFPRAAAFLETARLWLRAPTRRDVPHVQLYTVHEDFYCYLDLPAPTVKSTEKYLETVIARVNPDPSDGCSWTSWPSGASVRGRSLDAGAAGGDCRRSASNRTCGVSVRPSRPCE